MPRYSDPNEQALFETLTPGASVTVLPSEYEWDSTVGTGSIVEAHNLDCIRVSVSGQEVWLTRRRLDGFGP